MKLKKLSIVLLALGIPLSASANYIISTIAGNNAAGSGYTGDGGVATSAQLHNPNGVCLDSAKNLYIGDALNNVIRVVPAVSGQTFYGTSCPTAGNIYTIAGTGVADLTGDGGAPLSATMWSPITPILDSLNNLYFCDSCNYVIRVITAIGGQTLFGTSCPTANRIYSITATSGVGSSGLALDGLGNMYLANQGGGNLCKITSSGVKTTITHDLFNNPKGICSDSSGNIYMSSVNNGNIAKIDTSGNVTQFYSGGCCALCTDNLGNFYCSFTDVNRMFIFGNITAEFGNGNAGYAGDGSLANNSTTEFNGNAAICVDSSGNIYICDSYNHVIRKLTYLPPPTSYLYPRTQSSRFYHSMEDRQNSSRSRW